MRYPPKIPTNTLQRKQFNDHRGMPYEFELVKQYLIDTADRRERLSAMKTSKETK